MLNLFWVLNEDGHPVPVEDVRVWSSWFCESRDRVLARDVIGDVLVSTVFLGIDHDYSAFGEGNPLLWETMVFGGVLDGSQRRYDSAQAATEGHQAMIQEVMKEPGWMKAVSEIS